jgi:hypothetical protein
VILTLFVHHLEEFASPAEFHYYIVTLIVFEVFVDLDAVGVVELLHDFYLLHVPVRFPLLQQPLFHDLDCPFCSSLFVLTPVDFGVRSLSEQALSNVFICEVVRI